MTVALENPKENEVLVAEIETRLREQLLRILRPSLDHIASFDSRLDDLSVKVESHDELQAQFKQMNSDFKDHVQYTRIIADDLASRGADTQEANATTTSELLGLTHRIENQERQLDTLSNTVQKVDRKDVRIWEEIERLQATFAEATTKLSESLATSNKRFDKNHEDALALIRELQKQRVDMLDELFGETGVLSKLRHDLSQVQVIVASVPEMGSQVTMLWSEANSLSDRTEKCEVSCDESRATIKKFKETTDKRLADMNQEFNDKANRLLSHHGALMRDIRSDYDAEINSLRTLRSEFEMLEARTDGQVHRLGDSLTSESKRMDALHKEITFDMNVLKKTRAQDHAKFEGDLHAVKQDVASSMELGKRQAYAIDYVSSIVALVLECERVMNALSVQDFADRRAECWLGVSDSTRPPQPPMMAEDLFERRLQSKFRGLGHHGDGDLVQVDYRRGFKCDAYKPGQVLFKGKTYERREILLMHHKVLQQANAALSRGLKNESQSVSLSSFFSGMAVDVPAQKRANGGGFSAASKATTSAGSKAKTDLFAATSMSGPFSSRGFMGASMTSREINGQCLLAEDDGGEVGNSRDVHRTPRGSVSEQRPGSQGQRPGSQGQPQAGGSRAFPSLGQAGDADGMPLRLPSIGRDTGCVGSDGMRAPLIAR